MKLLINSQQRFSCGMGCVYSPHCFFETVAKGRGKQQGRGKFLEPEHFETGHNGGPHIFFLVATHQVSVVSRTTVST